MDAIETSSRLNANLENEAVRKQEELIVVKRRVNEVFDTPGLSETLCRHSQDILHEINKGMHQWREFSERFRCE